MPRPSTIAIAPTELRRCTSPAGQADIAGLGRARDRQLDGNRMTALVTDAPHAHISTIADNDLRAPAAERGVYSRLLQAARAVMPGDLSRQEPLTRLHRSPGAAAERAAASWLVPPLLIPIFFAGSIVAYAFYRLVHLGPAAFG